jgi:hypothetical protein
LLFFENLLVKFIVDWIPYCSHVTQKVVDISLAQCPIPLVEDDIAENLGHIDREECFEAEGTVNLALVEFVELDIEQQLHLQGQVDKLAVVEGMDKLLLLLHIPPVDDRKECVDGLVLVDQLSLFFDDVFAHHE